MILVTQRAMHFILADTDNIPQDDSPLGYHFVVTWLNKCDYKEKRSNTSLQKGIDS